MKKKILSTILLTAFGVILYCGIKQSETVAEQKSVEAMQQTQTVSEETVEKDAAVDQETSVSPNPISGSSSFMEQLTEEILAGEDVETEEAASMEEPEVSENEEYANLAIANVNDYVNIRKEPNTDSEIVGKIYKGAVAQVQEIAGENGDWFHILSGEVEGYIKSEYFYYGQEALDHVDEYVTRYATVVADRLNVRQEQNVDSKRIGYIDQGEKVKIDEDLGEWLMVSYTDEDHGYVSTEFVTVSEEFVYGISIEEEQRQLAEKRALEERKKQSEQTAPENTKKTYTPPANTYTSNEELRKKIVEYAGQYLGNKYIHGGKTLDGGTDCSGFTCFIYADFGYSISRTPAGQLSGDGRSIDYSQIQPGDIICYGQSKCTHVAMYIGDGQIIHSANSRKGVIIGRADYDNILGIKNIID